MPDIIAARCTACEHVVRVAASYGGKQVRCPKCRAVIIIPRPVDSNENLVTDDQLPEVAKDDFIEEDEPIPPPLPPAPSQRLPTARSVRRAGPRGSSRRIMAPPKSRLPLYLGLGAAGLVLIVIVVAAAASGRPAPRPEPPPAEQGPSPEPPPPPPPRPEERAEEEVRERLRKYVSTLNSSNVRDLEPYYVPGRRAEVRRALEDLYFKTWLRYENVRIQSVKAGELIATVDVLLDRVLVDRDTKRETRQADLRRSFSWRKEDGLWLISDGFEQR